MTKRADASDANLHHEPAAPPADSNNRLSEEDLAALRAAIQDGRAEIARGEGVPLEDVLAEFDAYAAE